MAQDSPSEEIIRITSICMQANSNYSMDLRLHYTDIDVSLGFD
jgi:hypothetical protein